METLKGLGGIALGIGAMAVLFFLAMLFFTGVAHLSAILLPWLFDAAWIVFAAMLFIFLPLSFFRGTRVFSCFGFLYGSFAYGICAWVLGFLVTYTLWGVWGVVAGLFIFGVGVVPVATLAAAFHGTWNVVWGLLTLVILTFGSRGYALHVAKKADEDAYERNTITLEAK